MAGRTIHMSTLKQIIRHRINGVALQTIAKAVGISRNTVKKYLRLIEVKQINCQDLLQLDAMALDALLQNPDFLEAARYQLLVSFFPYLESELGRPGVTRWVLWGEYRQRHPGGYSYSQFCEHYRDWKASRSGTLHLEQEPADKLFMDFTGKKLSIVDPLTGKVSQVETYIAVLGY